MSHTIRRKKDGSLCVFYVSKDSNGELNCHWFHSDSRDWNPPASFRRDLNREYRSKQNMLLRKSVIDGTQDDVIFDKHYHNAHYLYY